MGYLVVIIAVVVEVSSDSDWHTGIVVDGREMFHPWVKHGGMEY